MKLCDLHYTSVCVLLSSCAFAAFQMDRSAMSDDYWKIWNDEVQAKIDADIEKYRKADASVEVGAPDREGVRRQGRVQRLPWPLPSHMERRNRQGGLKARGAAMNASAGFDFWRVR